MFNIKPIIVLFLDRNRFQFYGGNLSGVISVDVPVTSIKDLEVVNIDELYSFIKQCVKQYALGNADLVIVLSESSYYTKAFQISEDEKTEIQILKFFELVPFDATLTKVYTLEKEKYAVATNKAFLDAIVHGFQLQGLQNRCVLPQSRIEPMRQKQSLDTLFASYVMKNIDTLSKQSITEYSSQVQPKVENKPIKGAEKHSSLPALLGVFGILMVILIGFVVWQFSQ